MSPVTRALPCSSASDPVVIVLGPAVPLRVTRVPETTECNLTTAKYEERWQDRYDRRWRRKGCKRNDEVTRERCSKEIRKDRQIMKRHKKLQERRRDQVRTYQCRQDACDHLTHPGALLLLCKCLLCRCGSTWRQRRSLLSRPVGRPSSRASPPPRRAHHPVPRRFSCASPCRQRQ